MSVLDNLMFGCGHLQPSARKSHAQRLADRVGVAHLLQRKPPALSGGEKQRVTLARAIASGNDILLLDEPFAALEQGRRQQLRALMEELHGELNLTILHVTHNVQVARSFAGRAAVMEHGRLVRTEEVATLRRDPGDIRVAAAIGEANLLAGELRAGALHWAGGCTPAASEWGDQGDGAVWLAVAAASVQLAPMARGPQEDAMELPGRVVGVELLGGCLHVRLDCGGTELTATLAPPAREIAAIGQPLVASCPRRAVALRPRA